MKAKDAAKIDGIDQWAFLSAANGASASARTEFECGVDYLLSDDDHVKISCFSVYVYVYFEIKILVVSAMSGHKVFLSVTFFSPLLTHTRCINNTTFYKGTGQNVVVAPFIENVTGCVIKEVSDHHQTHRYKFLWNQVASPSVDGG
jgi:hypothetical protein